ncbi:hypothetical protein EV122DRAFT_217581 [Schizophyllum commune]
MAAAALATGLPIAISVSQAATAALQNPSNSRSSLDPSAPPPPAPSAVPTLSSASTSHMPPAPPPPPPQPPMRQSSALKPSKKVNGSNNQMLCEYCHANPRFFDGGKRHPYCSKKCAGEAKKNNCEFCHQRAKFHDGKKSYRYCGKICAAAAAVQAGAPNEDKICLMCRKAEKQPRSHFCSKTCVEEAEKKGPAILEVPVGHVTFISVADQFKQSWRHAKPCPPVRRVYKILAPHASLGSYNAYKAAVEARGNFKQQGMAEGNECRRWHGTTRECLLGDKGHTQFCGSPNCPLCNIIKTSFALSHFGNKTGWGRFGKGIYTSSTSSKSNDYSSNKTRSPLKSILLNKVIVGKGFKMLHDEPTLTSPPAGCDSVLAEKGMALNYDELVVYREDAIRPSYLVMYEG